MIRNPLLEQAQERIEEDNYHNEMMEVYYHYVKEMGTRQARRLMKRKYNFVVKP